MIKQIPKEIREEVLSKAKAGERVKVLAQQYGISDRTIYGQLRHDTGEDVISILKYNKLKRENEELKRLIGELTLDMSLGENQLSSGWGNQSSQSSGLGHQQKKHLPSEQTKEKR